MQFFPLMEARFSPGYDPTTRVRLASRQCQLLSFLFSLAFFLVGIDRILRLKSFREHSSLSHVGFLIFQVFFGFSGRSFDRNATRFQIPRTAMDWWWAAALDNTVRILFLLFPL